MRLFAAVELDAEARSAIAATQKLLARKIGASDRGALKWVQPEHMHLTLVFLGEVDERHVSDITKAVSRDVEAPPFVAVCGGLGIFPPRGAPRILWLGICAGASELAAVQRELALRVEALGVRLEARPFHPHLTLARWRASRPSDGRRALAADSGTEIARLPVDHVSLFHSRLSSSGPTYVELARATLTPCRL